MKQNRLDPGAKPQTGQRSDLVLSRIRDAEMGDFGHIAPATRHILSYL